MAEHHIEFRLTSMCRVLRVHRSGYYAWLSKPKSVRAQADAGLLDDIKQFFEASMSTYGSPRIHRDLCEAGTRCGEKRVARLMRQTGLRSVRGYKRPRYRGGKPATTAPNRLKQQFTTDVPDQAWDTDITYIRTYEGWLYLAVVLDLYSRAVVGWAMKPGMATELVLDALLMAVWRRRPQQSVILNSAVEPISAG